MEVPTLDTDKEGLLRGGFCSVATEGEVGLLATNVDCNNGCVGKCNHGCNVKCNHGCEVVDPSDPEGGDEETSKAANPGAALMGFSLVF